MEFGKGGKVMKCIKCQREYHSKSYFLEEYEVAHYCDDCNRKYQSIQQEYKKNKRLSWIITLLICLVIGGSIYKDLEYEKMDKQTDQVIKEQREEMVKLEKERDHYESLYMDGDPVEIKNGEVKYNEGLFYGSKYYDENVKECEFDYINLQNASIVDEEYDLANAYRNGFINSFNEKYSKNCSWF